MSERDIDEFDAAFLMMQMRVLTGVVDAVLRAGCETIESRARQTVAEYEAKLQDRRCEFELSYRRANPSPRSI
jgi:hypothetical protein